MLKVKNEPAVVIGLIEALALAILALVAYLLDWEAELVALVAGVVGAAIAVVGALAIRQRVTPAD